MGNKVPRCAQCRSKEATMAFDELRFCTETCRRAWERHRELPEATRPQMMRYHVETREMRYRSDNRSEENSDERSVSE